MAAGTAVITAFVALQTWLITFRIAVLILSTAILAAPPSRLTALKSIVSKLFTTFVT